MATLKEMNIETRYIEQTDSTNRYLHDQTMPAGVEMLVVWTDFQTAGRGCGSNMWESERGKNLTFSVLLSPRQVAARHQFILSMANALALRDALAVYADGISIKWPNDIYWRDRKIAGTLIETTLRGDRIDRCIIGTGININQTEFRSDAPNPVSLSQIIGHEVERKAVLDDVCRRICAYMQRVEQGKWTRIRSQYHHHLYRLGATLGYQIGSKRVRAKLVGVTDDGHLQLLMQGGEGAEERMESFAFKEVQFIISS